VPGFVAERRSKMNALGLVLTMAFVLVVLGVIAYWLLVAPFRSHQEQFRDPRTGQRVGESPHLETRDEFEHRPSGYVPSAR
jgi:hypothetical protein